MVEYYTNRPLLRHWLRRVCRWVQTWFTGTIEETMAILRPPTRTKCDIYSIGALV